MNTTECYCGDARSDHTEGNQCTVCPCKAYAPTPEDTTLAVCSQGHEYYAAHRCYLPH